MYATSDNLITTSFFLLLDEFADFHKSSKFSLALSLSIVTAEFAAIECLVLHCALYLRRRANIILIPFFGFVKAVVYVFNNSFIHSIHIVYQP